MRPSAGRRTPQASDAMTHYGEYSAVMGLSSPLIATHPHCQILVLGIETGSSHQLKALQTGMLTSMLVQLAQALPEATCSLRAVSLVKLEALIQRTKKAYLNYKTIIALLISPVH